MGDFSIQISSRLIDRLTKEPEKVKRKQKKAKSNASTRSKVDHKQTLDGAERQKPRSEWPLLPSVFLPTPPPQPYEAANSELEAVRSVVKDSQKVLEKLEKQENNVSEEVTKRAKELREKEFKIPTPKPMPCSSENDAWMSCYKQNINDPLKCAGFARSFADCARRARQQATGN